MKNSVTFIVLIFLLACQQKENKPNQNEYLNHQIQLWKKQLVLNGAFKYPGANVVETIHGRKIMLDSVKDDIRINKLAKSIKPT